mmetsp:Transcript_6775/g.7690  ORF Transcript_6775/g.7690 Transcript_6775/m.7690 type:complete len:121 (+) Transcript_6775:178-540(+)
MIPAQEKSQDPDVSPAFAFAAIEELHACSCLAVHALGVDDFTGSNAVRLDTERLGLLCVVQRADRDVVRAPVLRSAHKASAVLAGSSNAQCKDEEASEQIGFERHGNADTLELKSAPCVA